MMKSKRQEEILNIIAQASVGTQEQLSAELKARGIAATQATISRDIKELHLVKEPTGRGSYRYVQSERKRTPGSNERFQSFLRDGTVSFESAQNLVVAKTMPGLAPALGSALDSVEIDGLIGTLAGDDTVLLIFRQESSARQFCETAHPALS